MSPLIDPYEQAQRQRRQRNVAFLQRHWKIAAPLIVVVAVALFVLPWLFMPFIAAFGLQIMLCMAVYLLARAHTTAFRSDEDDSDGDGQ